MTKILIITAQFYPDIAEAMLKGAISVLKKRKMPYDAIEVPGAFEIPAAIAMAIDSKKYDGYVALGCVIRGETSHYDYVCAESARGLSQLAIEHRAAIGNGILTVENREQAWERAALEKKNKGKAAAEACLAMMELKKRLGKKKR